MKHSQHGCHGPGYGHGHRHGIERNPLTQNNLHATVTLCKHV